MGATVAIKPCGHACSVCARQARLKKAPLPPFQARVSKYLLEVADSEGHPVGEAEWPTAYAIAKALTGAGAKVDPTQVRIALQRLQRKGRLGFTKGAYKHV